MADTTIQKQGEVFISQSEYDALRLAGNLQSNTEYHITKTPETATKDFVNNGFVAKVTNTTTSTKAYIAKTDGSQGTIDVVTGVAANTLAQRGAGGVLAVGTPVGVNDATPKAYVDAQKIYTHYVTITNKPNYVGEIILTISDKIDEPFDNLTMLRKGLYDIGKTIMATGYLRNRNDTSEPAAVVFSIELDSTGEVIQAIATYQTSTSTDITIIDIQDNGFWEVTDVIR